MGVEIERKFLVHAEKLPPMRDGQLMTQGYLGHTPAVRVRVINNIKAYLTIKGPGLLERAEFEYEIPVADGLALLTMAQYSLTKVRFRIGPWEVDCFSGALAGLTMAEIELPSADAAFDRPDWLAAEVTTEPQFSNIALAMDAVGCEDFVQQLLQNWTRIGGQLKELSSSVEDAHAAMDKVLFKALDDAKATEGT